MRLVRPFAALAFALAAAVIAGPAPLEAQEATAPAGAPPPSVRIAGDATQMGPGAAGTTAAADAAAPATVAPKKPRLVFTIRYGVDSTPDYPGSVENTIWHDFGLKFHYARLFGREFGHPDPAHETYGLRLRPAWRIVNGRDPSENPELAGTDYLFPTIEVGVGAVYTHRKYELWGDALYGLFGHEDWVGRIAGDYRMYPASGLEIRFGPRLFFGTNSYVDKYYGVGAAESAASGFPVFDPSPGLLRVGAEAGVNYDIAGKWDFTAAVTYDRLVGSAAQSPFVTVAGSEDQWTARIGFTRTFTWRF